MSAQRRALVIGGSLGGLFAARLFGSRIVARARWLGAYIEAQLKPPAERAEHERQPPAETIMREIGSMAVDIRALRAGAEG